MTDYSPISSLQKQIDLLRMEMEYERQNHALTLATKHLDNHIQESDCRYPVSIGNSEYNALDQLILTIRYEISEDSADTDFEPGKPLRLFFLDNDSHIHELPHLCFIEQVGYGVLEIAVPGQSALMSIRSIAQSRLLGIQLSIDTTSYEVMFDALSSAIRSDDEKFIHLRNTLIGPLHPTFLHLPPLSFPWLNSSQQSAVQKAVECREVAIIHGPPGTGKTTTLVEAIIETLQRETQVLVCAPSNAAVDWISEQLSKRCVNVLRIGNPVRISNEMLDCSYERRFAAHPDYPELWSIRKVLRDNRNADSSSRESKKRLSNLRDCATQLEIHIQQDLFNQARVVACTLIGSANFILNRRRFSTLFIDEAAQALEPACWAAILKADRVIFSGDHCQLPPTVKCIDAAHGGLDLTLMQKVAKSKPECVSLLTTQYRMHRDIMSFSSQWFYHGMLNAAPEVADRLISPLDTPLTWIDTSRCNYSEKESRTLSRSNSDEARMLIHILRDYIDMIGLSRIHDERVDFGIISPYRAQVRLIRKLLKWQKFFRSLRQQITVNSVDGFQGQERDVIILSMVRDNDQGSIGFLRDLRRMNVAITRARMKLIVVGNAETLSRHRFYAQLIEHFQAHGDFITLPSPDADEPPTQS